MKTFFLLLSTLLLASIGISQTSLQGTVTDAESGEPIIFGTVALYKNGILVTGTETDLDGFYSITEIDPGTYDVEFSYTGYSSQKIANVRVIGGKANLLNAKMSSGVDLCEVVVKYEAPMIEQDNTSQGMTIGADQIRNMPTRNVNALAGVGAGQKSKRGRRGSRKKADGGAAISIRSSRSNATNYYIDGVRVSGSQVQVSPSVNEETGASEGYSQITENSFQTASNTPLSTFSIDVDAASYSNLRRFIQRGQQPPADAVRIEEMINYFDYDYPEPKDYQPFEVITELSQCPWAPEHELLLIGLQGQKMMAEQLPPSNLVFLIDVSGSMGSENKLPLVKQSLKLLVDQLRPEDQVALVVYAGAAGTVLPPTSGADKEKIKSAIDRLSSGGSTAGAAGIQLAYKLAHENFAAGGNNRVVLATDGDFNVGVRSEGELVRLIEKEREKDIFLTVLGFGMGNYQDGKMQQLADKGNGNHYYIDNLNEGRKVLVNELTGTLFTIAKDVKLQLEFNPAHVAGYRLIGYENRLLADEDFNDDKKDAGELGSGHRVTALYEIIPTGVETKLLGQVDELKYRQAPAITSPSNELLTLKLRYKPPTGKKSQLIEHAVPSGALSFASTSDNFRLAASVAMFGMLLRDSEFKGTARYSDAAHLAKGALGTDTFGYRQELVTLIESVGAKSDPTAVK